MDNREIERRIEKVETDIDRLRREAKEREIRQLKWGIRVLGTITLGLAAWVWSETKHLFSLTVGK